MSIPVEIERKFVIRLPDVDILATCDGYTFSEIEQTYLESEEGVTHRVRARRYFENAVYTETKKVRIDKMSALEDERQISEDEYRSLLEKRKRGSVTLRKVRHTFEHLGKTVEIDVYPEWKASCVLEVELSSRDEDVRLPEFINVVKEVTGDKKYSNASMSMRFPDELI